MSLTKMIYELESAGLTLVLGENPRTDGPRGTESGWTPEAALAIEAVGGGDRTDTLIEIESRAGVLTVKALGKVIVVARRDAEAVWREVVGS